MKTEPVILASIARALGAAVVGAAAHYGLKLDVLEVIGLILAAEMAAATWGTFQGVPGETVRILVPLVFVLAGCSATSVLAGLKTADSIGRGVANVLGWCEDKGAGVTGAVQALKDHDVGKALQLTEATVAELRKNGVELPEQQAAILALAEELYAAKAIEQAARALAGRTPEGQLK